MNEFRHESLLRASATRRRLQLAWLAHVLEVKQWSQARLAAAAKIHPSTLVNFKLDKKEALVLEQSTIDRLAEASGICWTSISPQLPQASDNECLEITDLDHEYLRVLGVRMDPADYRLFRLTSDFLTGMGYMPGDYLATYVKPNRRPVTGDIVVARQTRSGTEPRLIARSLQIPYLCTDDGVRRNGGRLVIWNDEIEMIGVVEASGQLPHRT